MLQQVVSKVYLVFDGDSAGEKATLRTVTTAMDFPDLEMFVVRLPKDQDPDSFVRSQGGDELGRLIQEASSLLDYAISSGLEGSAPHAVPSLVREKFVPWLKTVSDPLKRSYLVGRISTQTKIPVSEIQRALSANAYAKSPPKPLTPKVDAQPEAYRPPTRQEYELLAHLFFATPVELGDGAFVEEFLNGECQIEPRWHQLAQAFLAKLKQGVPPAQQDEWSTYPDLHALALIDKFRSEREAFNVQGRKGQVEKLILVIRKGNIKKTITRLKELLVKPPVASQPEDRVSLLRAIDALNQELTGLDRI
jgi:DNA primase